MGTLQPEFNSMSAYAHVLIFKCIVRSKGKKKKKDSYTKKKVNCPPTAKETQKKHVQNHFIWREENTKKMSKPFPGKGPASELLQGT